jgi:SAM-dependent methyltransferase
MNESKLIAFLKYQSFHPGILGIFINPFYFIRSELARNVKRFAGQLNGKLLDFGCGRKPYEHLFKVDQYIGIDLEKTGHDHSRSKVDVYYDGKKIPFPDASFDALFCSEVLEHVFNPNEVLPEINRVLKPGARAIITTPFCWNEHEPPNDYARYTSFGLAHLLNKHGFRIIQLEKVETSRE